MDADIIHPRMVDASIMTDAPIAQRRGTHYHLHQSPLLPNNIERDAYNYFRDNWDQLATFISTVMSPERQQTTPLTRFSHEVLYRIAYTICWQGMRRQLYEKLIVHLSQELQEQQLRLSRSDLPSSVWFNAFGCLIVNHAHAISTISSIFAYLNRTYVTGELQSDLNHELRLLLHSRFIQGQSEKLFICLRMVADGSLPMGDRVVSNVILSLNRINADYYWFNPPLFQQHIPAFKTPPNATELAARFDLAQARLDVQMQLGGDGVNNMTKGMCRKHYLDPNSLPIPKRNHATGDSVDV
ncbi:hypothetical protein SeMB42_g02054 [Synchytrium endobioticum]|uniref:Cullin N-terminal domain-containing protein n=1 Tax=Synchytrium endobioticum TaxID=286115 RepID=A0A507DHC8_9FUNG|nr:hypothetical protein SeLEV6574_g01992 [Synchytrium endobioticum]TPX50946.1 hypothetical protein SeMB42_g02054 [Synchytrium endobioticum]